MYRFSYCIVMAVLLSRLATAQNTGVVKGVIVDENESELPGITITVTENGFTTATDDNGQFVITGLKEGNYKLLITGTGYRANYENATVIAGKTTFVILKLFSSPGKLQEITVTAKRNRYLRKKLSGTSRLDIPVFELPQSITVLSKQLLTDQMVFTPAEISRNISGVNTLFPYPGIYTDFNIRGIRATQAKFRNGMNMGVGRFGMLMEDMSYVESVEFVKGPATFVLGQGEPGGMFNVITKNPVKEKLLRLHLYTGSFNLVRGQIDAGGSIVKNGKISYRFNSAFQNNNTHIDYQENKRVAVAPALRWDITNKTSVTAEYNYDRFQSNGFDLAIPTTTGNQFSLPRSFSAVGPGIDPAISQNQFINLRAQHRFNNNWKLTAQAAYAKGFSKGYDIGIRGRIFPGDSVVREARYTYNQYENKTAQLFANGIFKIGKIENTILIGTDWGEQSFKQPANTAPNLSIRNLPGRFSLLNPNYTVTQSFLDTFISKGNIVFSPPAVVRYKAANLYHVIKFLPQLQVSWALRMNWYEAGTTVIQKDRVLTPRIGISYLPVKNTNIYFLYDRTFLPVAGKDFAGNEFKPQQGRNTELGIKREWHSGKLTTSLAFFQITKTNALTGDPAHPGFQIQEGEIESNGAEVDIAGSPVEGLNIIANYAYTDARFSKDTAKSNIVGRREQGPFHNINLWFVYRLQKGKLKGLGCGSGYSYLGNRATLTLGLNNRAQQQKIPDFYRLDAAIYYTYKRLNLALNIENLTSANNIFGTFDRRGSANVFNYLTTPGINWRLGIEYKIW